MKGWECPKCGSCYAPTVKKCSECGPQRSVPWSPSPTPLSPFKQEPWPTPLVPNDWPPHLPVTIS